MCKALAITAAMAFLSLPGLLFLPGADFWSTTRYCPWHHRIGYGPQVCKVKDLEGQRVMVEHADLDVNVVELSIHDQGKTTWILHPINKVRNFSNALYENTIKFDRSDGRWLIVNGERFAVTDLKQHN